MAIQKGKNERKVQIAAHQQSVDYWSKVLTFPDARAKQAKKEEAEGLPGNASKKKDVERNSEISASATTLQDKSFVQTDSNEGSESADTHSDHQRILAGKDTNTSDNSNGQEEISGEEDKVSTEIATATAYIDRNPTDAQKKESKRQVQFQYFSGNLSDLIQAAKGESKGLIKKIIAPVSSRLKAGIDKKGIQLTDDYHHTLDNSAIIHTIENHGGESELERGQIPITDADFERISDVVNNYDDILVDDGERGLNNIVYSKTYPDGTTMFVEEVRRGRKELAAVSRWKKKSPALTDANRNNATPISDLNKASSSDKYTKKSESPSNRDTDSSEKNVSETPEKKETGIPLEQTSDETLRRMAKDTK